MRVLILALLFTGFFLLFRELGTLEYIADALKKTRSGMNAASRQRSLADRQDLLSMHCLLWTSPSPGDRQKCRMPSSG